ncbi:MAG: DUF5686 family protein [Bacteroidales bacterium]
MKGSHELWLRETENPADRIMNLAIQNRKINSPYHNKTFKCINYHKLLIINQLADSNRAVEAKENLDAISVANDFFPKRDSLTQINDLLKKYHLFVNESVTEYYFKQPNREYQKLIASKTAGFENPILSVFLTQTQSFSFYQSDFIQIATVKYVNPVSVHTFNKYCFSLVDTWYAGQDTIYVIDYKPIKGVIFNSLKGTLYINSDGYAIQKVIASAVDSIKSLPIFITQQYEKQPNGTWFPTLLEAEIRLENFQLKNFSPLILSQITVQDVETDIPLKLKDFGIPDVEDQIDSYTLNEQNLALYRKIGLTYHEQFIYRKLDTLGQTLKLDRKLFFLQSLITGFLPVGPIDVDLASIVNFDNSEGFRLGLGLYTNNRVTKYVKFGGHFAYGLKDKEWKWGARSDFIINHNRDCIARIFYQHDVLESGRTQYFDRDYTMLTGEYYRRWLIYKFDMSDAVGIQFKTKITRALEGYASVSYAQNKTCFNYNYEIPIPEGVEFHRYAYQDFAIKIGFRLAFKEMSFKADDFILLARSPYPIVLFHYTRGIKNVWNSSFNYNKFDLKVVYKMDYKMLGSTEFCLTAGFTPDHLPYSLLYVPIAGYATLGFYGKEQFAVMRANEFLSSTEVSLFVWHNFGKMTQNRRFSPKIVLCQNIGFGWLNNKKSHYGVTFKTMEKGYFETGILVEDLLVILKAFSFGVGAFYRYGAYAYERQIDNVAFKINFRVAL